jgi:uncharacterized lipoprotein YddW (UPF0748 family)
MGGAPYAMFVMLGALASSPITLGDFDGETTAGWQRGGLELAPPQAREITLARPLSSQLGALSFWVRPAPRGAPEDSYTLLSARWQGADAGYFAVSQGWWEPTGRGRFYAVISNMDGAFCVADRRLVPNRWTHVVVSWRSASAGYCSVFFDGVQVAHRPIGALPGRQSMSRLAIGSDRESTDRRGRAASGILDELRYFPAGLSDRDVRRLYEQAIPSETVRHQRAFEWAEPYRSRTEAAVRPAAETRALFDESWQWARSREDVSRLVDMAARAGFNVLVPCVWHGRGTAYPSPLDHPHAELAASIGKFDALAFLIERAHRAGIQVHPWFTVVLREDEKYPQFFDAGTPALAYDIHRPAFREFAASLIEDVARRYAVDGINLDYIRALGVCRSDSCARDYAQATGRDLRADIEASTVVGAARSSLERWQDGAMLELVSSIARRTRAARPGAIISVSGHPVPLERLRPLEGRAEVDWQRRGLIDAIFAMEYGAEPHHEILASVATQLREPTALVWLFANYERLDGIKSARPPDNLVEYVRFARARVPGSGVGFYLRDMLNEQQIDALDAGPFRDRVPPRWASVRRSP